MWLKRLEGKKHRRLERNLKMEFVNAEFKIVSLKIVISNLQLSSRLAQSINKSIHMNDQLCKISKSRSC